MGSFTAALSLLNTIGGESGHVTLSMREAVSGGPGRAADLEEIYEPEWCENAHVQQLAMHNLEAI